MYLTKQSRDALRDGPHALATLSSEVAPSSPRSTSSPATRRARTGAAFGTEVVGCALAGLGVWQTGLVAAIPAATGLAALAASDLSTRRLSLRTLRVATLLVVASLVIEAASSSEWSRLAMTMATAVVVALTALAAWLGTRAIAFGDVLLLPFAVLVPAWLSPRAAGATVFTAIVVAGGAAMIRRGVRRGDRVATVALGPALLAGWVVAVVWG